MHFTKLRLIGFKSFVEPQEFVIEDGLTGIVGPNGCGKSNLVEALRWVMGENSYKNMRASGMNDVIFSGSNTRPSRNTAEVILYLDNRDRSAPPSFNDADELQVSRRIERDNGSTYSINSKDVRAKDVQLLFADQSTGARSPSMVGQGRIGELIQAKPQARRALLEEAAGISGLYSRRHEAELRLRAAETNLERLEDVVGDLSGRIDSLKRQARQANRFKSLSAQIREIEAGLFYLNWSTAKSLEIELESGLTAATVAVAQNAQTHMHAEKARDQAKGALPIYRENSAKAAATHQRLILALREIEAKAERDRARKSEIMRQLQQFADDIAREQQLLQDNHDMVAQLNEEEARLSDELEDAKIMQEEQRADLVERESLLQKFEAQFADLTAKRAEASAEESQLTRQITDAQQRQMRLSETIDRLSADIAGLNREIAELTKDDVSQRLNAFDAQIESLQEGVENGEAAVRDFRERQNALHEPLSKARDALNILISEKETLIRLNNSFKIANFPPVLEAISVDSGYELALGVALGDDLLAPLECDASIYWRDLTNKTAKINQSDCSLPRGLPNLAQFVRAPHALNKRLQQIGIVKDEDGFIVQAELKSGQRLVSREGRLWRWDGLCLRADAPSASAQRLAQNNRIKELESLIKDAEQNLTAVDQHYQNNEKELNHAIASLADCRNALTTASLKREEARKDFALFQKANAELSQKRAILIDNMARSTADLDESIMLLEALEVKRENLPASTSLELELTRCSQQLTLNRQQVADIRAVVQTALREASARMQRLEAVKSERKNWDNRIANAQRQLTSLEVRSIDLKSELEELAIAPDDIELKKQALLDEIAKAESEKQNLSDILTDHENQLAELEEATAKAFVHLSHAREERARAEERLNAAVSKRSDIETRIRSALDCSPMDTLKLAGFNVQNLPEIASLENRLDNLRMERERLGAVNLRAEEEENELRANYDAMTKERDDIVEAIKKLRQAIQSLNKEGRDRLLAAFDKVNQEFQRLFAHLFGGGNAELELIESDDPLNAGLEIIARPPGKKPQTMTLLSGGEQALTAMSLIFAVFLTNPAPICVLDEVDAPLDDHNVERYCNLLQEMTSSTDTRFLVITHNPITMAQMNRLFGVTMAEQGVSQLVSVDLHRAEELAVQKVKFDV